MSPKRLAGHAVTVEVVDVTSDHAEVAGCDVRAVAGVVHDGDAGAGLVAVVGVVICEGILDIEMVRSQYLLDVSNTFALNYALIASLAAIVAMGLAHLLVFTTPRPLAFYSWIIGLATAIAAALPFAEDAGTDA